MHQAQNLTPVNIDAVPTRSTLRKSGWLYLAIGTGFLALIWVMRPLTMAVIDMAAIDFRYTLYTTAVEILALLISVMAPASAAAGATCLLLSRFHILGTSGDSLPKLRRTLKRLWWAALLCLILLYPVLYLVPGLLQEHSASALLWAIYEWLVNPGTQVIVVVTVALLSAALVGQAVFRIEHPSPKPEH